MHEGSDDTPASKLDRLNDAITKLPATPHGPIDMSVKSAVGKFRPDNDPAIAERRAKAVALRAAGYTFRQIGKALGVSHTQAHNYVTEEIQEARTATREVAENLRHIAHIRLETMIGRLYTTSMPNKPKDAKPEDPPPPLDLLAMDRLIRVMVFHARLMGYEEPQKFQVDINEVRVQFGVIVERIAKVIPEDAAPRVMEVLDACMKEMEAKQTTDRSAERRDAVKYRDVIDQPEPSIPRIPNG